MKFNLNEFNLSSCLICLQSRKNTDDNPFQQVGVNGQYDDERNLTWANIDNTQKNTIQTKSITAGSRGWLWRKNIKNMEKIGSHFQSVPPAKNVNRHGVISPELSISTASCQFNHFKFATYICNINHLN